jgi:hypothetical protein
MKKEEKENILDQHKSIYDGYVTKYGQQINNQPLYIQDLANDKNGITVSNKGNVSTYKNVGINENVLDTIGDGENDLKNGTVDLDSEMSFQMDDANFLHDILPSPNEDEHEIIISLGDLGNENSKFDIIDNQNDYTDESENGFNIQSIDNLEDEEYSTFDDLPYNEFFNSEDIEDVESLENSINESLDMFKRFKKYN